MSQDQLDNVREVRSMREVPRDPEHCGVKMRKLQGTSAVDGSIVTVYACDKCGAQRRITPRTPVPLT